MMRCWNTKNNFLAAVHFGKVKTGVSFLDISTGDYWISEGGMVQIEQLLQNFAPAEVLVAKPSKKTFADLMGEQFNVFYLEDWIFESSYALEQLTAHFKTLGLKGFGIEDMEAGVISAGAILHYLKEAHHNQIPHITSIRRILRRNMSGWIDLLMRNLKLFQSTSPNGVALIDILDHTLTQWEAECLNMDWLFPREI